MTNKEAWHKGFIDGFKGLNPRPDYPLVGLAGSYRLGYEAGMKRRKDPKGKRNPGFIRHALTKRKVQQARRSIQAEIARVQNRIAELEQEIIEFRHGPIWKNDKHAKQWAAQASLKKQKLQAVEKQLIRGLNELPVINPRRNGIVEAAAGLQALEYIGAKARRGGLGRKPKYNPGEARYLIQVTKAKGGREQFTTNSAKEARETAASWYSRGASVTIVDRKNKTQTVYGKKNPGSGLTKREFETLAKEYGEKAAKQALAYWYSQPETFRRGIKALPFLRANELLWRGLKVNPRAKGSRDVLGVWHAENPGRLSLVSWYVVYKSGKGLAASGFKTKQAAQDWINKQQTPWLYQIYRKTHRETKNPSVTDLSRTFQGEADGAIDRLYAADGAPANLARAGKLVFLKIKGRTFRLPGAVVAIAPNEKLWITGKPPLFETKARKGEGLDVGEVTHICYETAKQHIGDGKTFEYVHEFGEDGGKRPHLIIDHEGMPILRGGDYKIRAEGIVN